MGISKDFLFTNLQSAVCTCTGKTENMCYCVKCIVFWYLAVTRCRKLHFLCNNDLAMTTDVLLFMKVHCLLTDMTEKEKGEIVWSWTAWNSFRSPCRIRNIQFWWLRLILSLHTSSGDPAERCVVLSCLFSFLSFLTYLQYENMASRVDLWVQTSPRCGAVLLSNLPFSLKSISVFSAVLLLHTTLAACFISPFHQSEIRVRHCIFLQRSSHEKYQKLCSHIPSFLSDVHVVETSDSDMLLGYGCLISLPVYTKQTFIFAVKCC